MSAEHPPTGTARDPRWLAGLKIRNCRIVDLPLLDAEVELLLRAARGDPQKRGPGALARDLLLEALTRAPLDGSATTDAPSSAGGEAS